jgi:hypothetical protein
MALIIAGSFLFGLGVALRSPIFMVAGLAIMLLRPK